MLNRIKKLLAKSNNNSYVRYLRARGVKIGENSEFMSPIQSDVDVGRGVFVSIGDNCVISAGVSIIAHDYSWKNLMISHDECLPSGGKAISIGNNVFIGAHSIILGGVSIGDNSIVGAGAVVCKSIPGNMVYAGNPAHEIMTLDAYYEKRKDAYVEDAIENARLIYKRTGRLPTISEMRNFAVLFMPRTDENIKKYVEANHTVGMSRAAYVQLLMNTKPTFSSYEAFLNIALKE